MRKPAWGFSHTSYGITPSDFCCYSNLDQSASSKIKMRQSPHLNLEVPLVRFFHSLGAAMYWTSALVGKAVALELVPPQSLQRIAQRVRRRAGDQPGVDLHWADELVRARLLSRYQAQILLASAHAAEPLVDEPTGLAASPLKIGPYIIYDRVGRDDLGETFRGRRATDKSQSAIKLIAGQWIAGEPDRARLAAELDRWGDCDDSRIV